MTLAGRWPTILKASLLAGSLDMLAACMYYFIKTGNSSYSLIPKFIASAIFGKAAFSGGAELVFLGLLLHYAIAFFWTVFFFWNYQNMSFLGINKLLSAIVYGFFVWLVMNGIVVPLSRVAHRPFNAVNALVNIGILIACIGCPLAWMAAARRRKAATGG